MGPDLDGRYGGQKGTGGLEAIVPGPDLFCPVVSDARGNVLAVYDGSHGGLIFPQRELRVDGMSKSRPRNR
jgi:hypothetical protein